MESRHKIERIDIELTSKCNLHCLHCHAEAGASHYKELSIDTVKQVIDDIYSYGIQNIALGGGEPLLYNGLAEIVKYIKKKKISVEIVTNGTLINHRNCEIFEHVDDIYITLLSTKSDIHDKITNTKYSYILTLKGLDILQSAGLNINLITVANKLNFKEILDLDKKFKNLNKIVVLQLYPLGRASKDLMLNPHQWKYLMENAGPNYEFYINYEDLNGCHGGKNPCILSSGDIVPCKILRDFFILGNINENPFSYVWNNSNLDILYPMQDEVVGGCSKCTSWESCRGGCRGAALLITGNINASDPLCWRNYNV